jgi:hypothetical protein
VAHDFSVQSADFHPPMASRARLFHLAAQSPPPLSVLNARIRAATKGSGSSLRPQSLSVNLFPSSDRNTYRPIHKNMAMPRVCGIAIIL